VALVASAAGVAGWYTLRPSGPSHPSAWDPRVADLARFVEAERGLSFDRPVHVDFLTDAEFRTAVTTDKAELSDEDRRDLERSAGLMRAMGLLDGDVDLFNTVNKFQGEGVLAFYDTETERIRVRGTELTIKMKGTIVHELTHALQDQYFDLEREWEGKAQEETFPAMYEGDAERVQSQWVASLGNADQQAWLDGAEKEAESMDISDIPEIIVQIFAAPYSFGKTFVDILVEANGQQAVDRALLNPPAATAHLLDPFRFLANEEPVPVPEPALAAGEEKTDSGDFGAMSLYQTLAHRLPADRALRATDVWAGDAYVTFRKDGRDCMKADFKAKDPNGASILDGALGDWADALPSQTASVTRDGDIIHVSSCDPGAAAARSATGDLATATALALFRAQVGQGALVAGTTAEEAGCVARTFVRSLSMEELMAYATSEGEESEAALIAGDNARQVCINED
jgi:hypothetical protein